MDASRELIIDGDLLVYRFSHSNQRNVDWDDGVTTSHADGDAAKVELDSFVQGLMEATGADCCTIGLSDTESSFRKDLCPEYKARRGEVRRPMLYTYLRATLLQEYGAIIYPSLEGDDVCGIVATDPWGDVEPVIASIDKDLLTVPGLHYNWTHDEPEVFEVTKAEAALNFYTQVLTGDHTDGYRGIPGVGPKRAEKLLKGASLATVWRDVIVPAYEKAGLDEATALMYARCAWILHHDDYEKGEIRLWTPERKES